MKTLFLSDIHLGSPLFKDKEFILSLLNDISFDIIILLGDIIDSWEDDVDSIIKNNVDIINTINKKNVLYLMGNHEPNINIVKKIFPNIDVYKDNIYLGMNVVCTHGHQFDNRLRSTIISKLTFYMYWIIERIVKIDIRPYFRELFSIAFHRDKDYYEDLVLDVEKRAVRKFKNDYKSVIMGHTHIPKIATVDNFLYVNCGDWSHSNSYVILNNDIFQLYTKKDGLVDMDKL